MPGLGCACRLFGKVFDVRFKAGIYYILGVALFLGGLVIARSGLLAQEVDFQTKAEFAYLVDADKDIVFFQKNADKPMPPASMSKMMTLALVFQELKEGRLQLVDEVRMSVNAWRTGGAPSRTQSMFVPVKSMVTVEELIRGMIVQSGNDAAIAIAEHISGSEEKFAAAMEAYGKKIGLTHSTFRNATGLPHKEHLMSARDIGKLARHLIYNFPEYYKYFAEDSFKYRRFTFRNLNPLLKLEEGYDGLKTGYTEISQYGVVASLTRHGRRLIVVLNGMPKQTDRRDETQKLVNWVYENFTLRQIEAQTQKFSARVWGGEEGSVGLSTAGALKVYAPKEEASPDIICEVIYKGPLKAPITQGQAVAKLRVIVANTEQEFDLYADETVPRANFVYRALDSVFYLIFGWLF